MGYEVTVIKPDRALVLDVAVDMDTWHPLDPGEAMPGRYLDSSWVWWLDAVDESTTRPIVRIRQAHSPGLASEAMLRGLIDPGSFLMHRKTMLGIKQPAEATMGLDNHEVQSRLLVGRRSEQRS